MSLNGIIEIEIIVEKKKKNHRIAAVAVAAA